jgi:sortase B
MTRKKKALLLLLIAVFLYSAFQLVSSLLEYNENQRAFEDVREEFVQVEIPEPPDAGIPHAGGEVPEQTFTEPMWDMDVNIDFEGLKAINRQVIGWIMVPDSPINYPIMKAADNQKYLTRALDGKYNKLGSIFMDYRNKSDYSDQNTIIYGHYTKNGSMFGSLHSYREEEYLDTHRYVYIITEEGTRIYEIFNAFVADVFDDIYYNLDQRKESQDGDIITLSTCTTSGRVNERFVVQGKRIYEDDMSGQ